MSKSNGSIKEPLIRITKRSTIKTWQAWAIRVAAIVAALIVSGLLALILIDKLRQNPGRIFDFFKCFAEGVFSNIDMTWKFFKDTAVLLCISLAITPAFRMKFWNIGAEGQTLMGILGTIAMSFYFGGKIPEGLLLLIMFIVALLCGGIWGVIPAIFKTLWNTNETLFTLMMNYVASFLVSFFLLKWIPSGNAMPIQEHGWLPKIGHNYLLIIIASVVIMVLLYAYLNYSKHGYEISVIGGSENTARYIGINVNKVVIRTMILSGVLCGLAGFLIGAGLDHMINSESVGGQGFTAIMVSWLAKFNPLFMVLTSGLVIFLQMGAEQISETFDVQGAMPDIIVGVILFFIIGCEFFINYQIHFRKKTTKSVEVNSK